jgi:hypothetical protein
VRHYPGFAVPCTISTLCVHSISAIRQQSQVATVPQKYTTRRAGSPRTTATSLQKPAWPRRVDGSESELLLGDQKCSSCRAPFDSLHRPRYRAVYTRPDPPRARRHRIDRPLIKTRCVRAGRACRRVGTLVIVKCLLYIRICFVLFCFVFACARVVCTPLRRDIHALPATPRLCDAAGSSEAGVCKESGRDNPSQGARYQVTLHSCVFFTLQ